MNQEKKQRIYKTIMLVIITIFITAMVTATVVYRYAVQSGNTKYIAIANEETKLSSSIKAIRKVINQYYLGDIDETKLIESAIKGYVSGLEDKYTEYFSKEEMEEYTQEVLGHFYGIGIYMVKDAKTNNIMVLAPVEGSPAAQAGIKPGDKIIKVDGVTYTGDSLSEVSNKIKGEKGTKVKLEILRGEETLQFEVERKDIKINHITAEKLENSIGYLKVNTFDEGCYEEFKEKYQELKEQGIQSLIVDLRNNGGGLLDEATDMADLFMEEKQAILITVDKDGKEKVTKTKQGITIDMPVVVLTNEYTASASEVLAGALKSHKKAKIVGTKTYGKGVIQVLKSFSDGSGIKITTNEYYTPNRDKINEIGIIPDVEVNLPEELQNELSIEKEKDVQLQKAIELLK